MIDGKPVRIAFKRRRDRTTRHRNPLVFAPRQLAVSGHAGGSRFAINFLTHTPYPALSGVSQLLVLRVRVPPSLPPTSVPRRNRRSGERRSHDIVPKQITNGCSTDNQLYDTATLYFTPGKHQNLNLKKKPLPWWQGSQPQNPAAVVPPGHLVNTRTITLASFSLSYFPKQKLP